MRKLFALVLTVVFLVAIPAVAFAAYSGSTVPSTNTPQAGVKYTEAGMKDGDLLDNNIGNANATGKNIQLPGGDVWTQGDLGADINSIVKSKSMMMQDFSATKNQRTHGAYQANTNSCATCHQTHTGAAKDLLLKQGVFESCTACHDGTLGFYNVYAPSTAGTFGGTVAGNGSVHMANGTVAVTVAPGYFDYSGANNKPKESFDCASCHAPHGSYSDRILHYSPDGMSDVDLTKKGNKLAGLTVQSGDVSLLTGSYVPQGDFVLYKGAPAAIPGFVYATEAADAGATNVVVVLRKVAGAYTWDNNPWVAGFEHDMDKNGNTAILNYTQFYDALAGTITEDRAQLSVRYGHAYAIDNGEAVVTADIARAYVVKLTSNAFPPAVYNFGGVPILKINTDIYDEKNYGYAISKYCGACHTDYFIHSGARTDGNTMTLVYRHSTDKDRFNCLKCHFAHGTDATIMKDALDRDVNFLTDASKMVPTYGTTTPTLVDATAYLLDKNPSSALKRYTNMAVCWKCHSGVSGKSSKLMNNMEYYDNYTFAPDGGYATSTEPNWTNGYDPKENSANEPYRMDIPELTKEFR